MKLGKTRWGGVIGFYFSTVYDYNLSISPTPRIDSAQGADGIDELEKHSVMFIWYQKAVHLYKSSHQERGLALF